jgi:hypothetical protein
MSFDSPRHTTTSVDRPDPGNQRTTFLGALARVMTETHPALMVTLLPGTASGPATLRVTNASGTHHTERIGCDLTPDGWRFTWIGWSDDRQTIGPVDDLFGICWAIVAVVGIRHR